MVESTWDRWWPRAALTLLLAMLSARMVSIYTENINWDEFALMQRSANALRTGQLQGGGRPGLSDLLLAPIVLGCVDGAKTVRQARWVWTVFTGALVVALFELVRRAQGSRSKDGQGAWLAVCLLVLVPVFHRWSLQVRTDQPALAFTLWGGVALLTSRAKLRWAAIGGAAAAVGYLFSQKALYAVGLIVVLAASVEWIDPPPAGRKAALKSITTRYLVFAAAAAAVWLLYRFALPLFWKLPPSRPLETSLSVFAHYRRLFGFRAYEAMLPTLRAHIVLLALSVIAAGVHLVRSRTWDWSFGVAAAVAVMGVTVGLFHAAAFPYFWMTLGLFPAVTLGLMFGPVHGLLARLPGGKYWMAIVLCVLAYPSLRFARKLLRDTQRVQRESFSFIEQSFPPLASGFQAEGALFCRDDLNPLPVYFTEHIVGRLQGVDGERNTQALIAEFKQRPVYFLVETHVFDQFPKPLRDFWRESYHLYHAKVFIPGRHVQASDGTREVELHVPGVYRWHVPPGVQASLFVDGQRITPSSTVTLTAGKHSLHAPETGKEGGLLLYDVPGPPAPELDDWFYSRGAINEIIGQL